MNSADTIPMGIDEAVRRRFESDWRASGRQPVERYLPDSAAPNFLGTLVELVRIDLELTWKANTSPKGSGGIAGTDALPRVESYCARFPQLNRPAVLLDLLQEEYAVRHRYGDHPSVEEYHGRFPALIRTERELTGERDEPRRPSLEIPGYQILGILGEGGMGTVYHARQLSLNRHVALKVISAGTAARTEDLARFRVEAEAAAQLQHPNIVQIHEIGDFDGHPFLALEFVEGQSLAPKLREGPVSELQAARWAQTIALTLSYVHQRGILHRDLKPANVLLRFDGVLKIADFGLAKRLTETFGQTLTGAVVGTPSYSAPELVAGRTRGVGPAVDIYAIGATLYEMLTGRPPFRGENAAETILQVLREEPVSVTRLRPRIANDLATICHKCLQKEPGRRYPTAEALAEDLRRFIAGEPISARRVSTAGRLLRWARRNPALAAATAAAMASTVLVAVISIVLAVRQTRAAKIIAHKQQQTQAALNEAHARELEAEELSAGLVLDQALSLCQQGEIKAGLLWMARSLTMASSSSSDLQLAIRSQMACWGREISYPRIPAIRHRGTVLAVALGRDGKLFITGSADRTARLWDAVTGSPATPVLSHHGSVRAVGISPDGTKALTASEDGTAQIWNARDGSPLGDPLRHGGPVLCAIFSADGALVATGSGDGTARLWDSTTGHPTSNLLEAGGHVTALAFTPDGQILATASRSELRLWHVPTGQQIGRPLLPPLPAQAIAISPDGQTLAVAYGQSGAGGVQLWDLKSQQTRGLPLPHPNRVTALAFSQLGNQLSSGCDDGTARLWNSESSLPVGSPFVGQRDVAIHDVALSSDGRILAAGCADGSVRVWDTIMARPIGTSITHQQAVSAIALSRDGFTLLSGSDDTTARLWTIAPGQSVGVPVRHEELPAAVVYDRDRRVRLVLRPEGDAILEDAATNKPLGVPLQHEGASLFERQVICIALSPDGRIALTGGRDQTARIWDAVGGKLLAAPLHHRGAVNAVAFLPDGRMIATGSEDRTTQRWDVSTGQPVGSALSHRGPVTALAFSPDGQRLLTACSYFQDHSSRGQGRLWDISLGVPIGQPLPHLGRINTVAFSSDGRALITAGDDSIARFWEAASGRPLGPGMLHPGPVICLEVSPDKETLITTVLDPATSLGSMPSTASSTQIRGGFTYTWRMPRPLDGTAERIRGWAEMITGLTLDSSNTIHRLDDSEWLVRRQQIQDASVPSSP